MRKEILVITGIVLLISSVTTQAEITDVFIFPEEPIIYDEITINVFGEENYDVSITDSILNIDETSIEIDIYIDGGILPWITPWSHTENIGMLFIGTYDVTVNTFVEFNSTFNDTFSTTFEVVPEPATILLLFFGFTGIRGRR